MTIYRCILPDWAKIRHPSRKPVVEGEFTQDEILKHNDNFYNIYFFPNYPSIYNKEKAVDGPQVDTFRYVFIDMDLKDQVYSDKESFLSVLKSNLAFPPTIVIDSGRGIHAYWEVSDLSGLDFLKLQRRLARHFNTDLAVSKICQLMRVPNTVNTKDEGNFKLCELVYENDAAYTCEQLDKNLPPITKEDEDFCTAHYNKTYRINVPDVKVDDQIPLKFANLIKFNKEVKSIWSGLTDDRSKSDFRLAHVMYANDFTKAEATSVLVNSAKALARAPVHRISYATNIVDQIWLYEESENKDEAPLSSTVKDILERSGDTIKGTRFPCWTYLDNTHHGFRLGQVVGLVAGSGVGKTAMALNMFMGFVQNNPDYDHFFIPLEQPANEIADRWRTMCGTNTSLYEKVHVISNYAPDGSFRDLSLDQIKDYLIKFQESTKRKVGCVVIDHIGVLANNNKLGQDEGVKHLAKAMKSFAVQTNTMLIMQSQTSREKAGIGDLELNKDAAFGTSVFENFCDYLITIWQPVKRCYFNESCPTVTAFKFCKIRHKKKNEDKIQEDVRYMLFFDPTTEKLRELTQDEEISFDYFNKQCANIRKQDRKSEVLTYTSVKELVNGIT